MDVRLLEGDCLEVMPTLPAGSVDAIVTDPPYGTQVDRDGYGRRGIERFIEGDSDLSDLDGMLAQAGRVLTKDAWLAVFCSPKKHADVAAMLDSHGFPVAHEVIWDKASPGLGAGIRYQHETILLSRRGQASGKSSLFSVLRYHVSRDNKSERHPHEKPVGLMSELVRYCAAEGQVVLDPFAGGGPTLAACQRLGRKAIGIECDPRWLPLAGRQIEASITPLFSRDRPTQRRKATPLFAE